VGAACGFQLWSVAREHDEGSWAHSETEPRYANLNTTECASAGNALSMKEMLVVEISSHTCRPGCKAQAYLHTPLVPFVYKFKDTFYDFHPLESLVTF
jgi:hypothetical protein